MENDTGSTSGSPWRARGRRRLGAAGVALALVACGSGAGGRVGADAAVPGPGADVAAPDRGGAAAAAPADSAAASDGSTPTDAARPEHAPPMDGAAVPDGPLAPAADPTAAIQVAPIAWKACLDPGSGDDCA